MTDASSASLGDALSGVLASDLFADPTLPLVVDVGCGFGVSLLGMALEGGATPVGSEGGSGGGGGGGSGSASASASARANEPTFNYLGGDLSGHAIGTRAADNTDAEKAPTRTQHQ